jgi:glycosyltransferase involved in cell wall biosynthesis
MTNTNNKSIAFLMGPPVISGGMYVVFQHALHAKTKGYEIYIITEKPIKSSQLDWYPEAKSFIWITYDSLPKEDFNYAFATWWRTSLDLHRVSAEHYCYFVQSIESKFYSKNDVNIKHLVDSTYLLPVNYITEATWIQKHLSQNYSQSASLAKNGARKDLYTVNGEAFSDRPKNKLRVLIEGPLGVPFKNVERSIELAIKSKADEIWLLTSSDLKEYPGVNRVFSRVPITETPKIYRSCHVLLKLSYVEGMFGPPLEMFHCGGTAIVYNVTGHDEYIIDKKNAIVIKKDDESAVIRSINELKDDSDKLKELSKNAIITANEWMNWKTSSEIFLSKIENEFSINKSNLLKIKSQSLLYLRWFEELNIKLKTPVSPKTKIVRFLRKNFPHSYKQLKNIRDKII